MKTEWQTAIIHLVARPVDKFNVQGAEQKEILAMLSGLKGEIVEDVLSKKNVYFI